MTAAFWLFVTAAVTDAADGAMAKMFNACTRIGSYLDPLADKVLIICVYVSLDLADYLPHWLVIIVVLRDILILMGAVSFLLSVKHIYMQPLVVGKINTLVQVVLAGTVLGGYGLNVDVESTVSPMIILVGSTTLLSVIAYSWVWGRTLLNSKG